MGTGYTSISDYLNANAGTVGREQGELARDVAGQVAGARAAADGVLHGVQPGQDWTEAPGYLDALSQQNAALDSAANLQTQGGLSDLLRQRNKADPGYTQGKSMFDASLLTGAAPFGAVVDQAKSLSGYLDAQGAAAAGQPPTRGTDAPTGPDPEAIDAPTRDPGKDWSDPTAPWRRKGKLPKLPVYPGADDSTPAGGLGDYLNSGGA
jgi:hypothetical protein